MDEYEMNPFFSVIIPTRNRSDVFKRSINSVLEQAFSLYEIIIVNDGSDNQSKLEYERIIAELSTNIKITMLSLVFTPNGHGPGYARNYGVQYASGKYLCFLDDDDEWSDDLHLTEVYKSIKSNNKQIDAYLSNQKAFYSDGTLAKKNIWIEDLINKKEIKNTRDSNPVLVDSKFLLQSSGFAHLNCTIVSKHIYQTIDGMDENIRYEEDRDFYLRLIDKSKYILYSPRFIAKHYIPNSILNASKKISDYDKFLYQLRMYDKGIIFSGKRSVRDFCMKHKQYTMKKLCESMCEEKRFKDSLIYSFQALVMGFSIKYFLFTLYLMIICILDLINKKEK